MCGFCVFLTTRSSLELCSLSLHDALPICGQIHVGGQRGGLLTLAHRVVLLLESADDLAHLPVLGEGPLEGDGGRVGEIAQVDQRQRSEERRVGKEGKAEWARKEGETKKHEE